MNTEGSVANTIPALVVGSRLVDQELCFALFCAYVR
jgi:hypothetical protein